MRLNWGLGYIQVREHCRSSLGEKWRGTLKKDCPQATPKPSAQFSPYFGSDCQSPSHTKVQPGNKASKPRYDFLEKVKASKELRETSPGLDNSVLHLQCSQPV